MTHAAQRIADYEVVAKLGKGGMGWVFKGIHTETGKEAAIKVLPPEMAVDEKFVTRFLREAQAATILHHKNIVRVYEAGQYQSIYYIALEYIQGETLAHALEREGTIPLRQALNVIYQVACGLAHAHERGIIHRDIKPANIMITTDGTAKIMDMGLAKWTRSERHHDPTRPGFTVGTPAYMSPEQVVEPESLDERTDIYSLGATLYHILTGKPPHLGKDAQDVMLKIVKTDVDYPEEMPDIVVRLLKKMLAKRRNERFRNAESLLKALEKVMRHFGVEVPKERQRKRRHSSSLRKAFPKQPAPFVKPARRQYVWLYPLIGAVAIVLIVGLIVGSSSQPSATGSKKGSSKQESSTKQKSSTKSPQSPPQQEQPPISKEPTEEQRLQDEAEKAFESTVRWYKSNSDRLVEACRRFEALRTRYPGILAAKVSDYIEEIATKVKEQIDKAMEEATKLANEGKKNLAKVKLQEVVDKYSSIGEISVDVVDVLMRAKEFIGRLR